jgi:hypothetical protein
MKNLCALCAAAILLVAPGTAVAASRPLVVTMSNTTDNALLVYDATGTLIQSVATGGQGGASSNAGGIAVHNDAVAVVNFGSLSVSILEQGDGGFAPRQVVPTYSQPVSVAFGKDHLYVLGTTTIESHPTTPQGVAAAADGVATLLQADGSAAQVGVVGNQLIVSEKSGAVELIGLRQGAVWGDPQAVDLPPGGDNTPFGLVTRGSSAYVTIAASDVISLIRNGEVLAMAATGTPNGPGQHSPCWIAVSGPYLYSTNSPSHSVSRLIAAGQNVTLDDPVAASTGGAPIDVAATEDLLAVLESNGNGFSHLTQFAIDGDGRLTPLVSTAITSAANGVAIVPAR